MARDPRRSAWPRGLTIPRDPSGGRERDTSKSIVVAAVEVRSRATDRLVEEAAFPGYQAASALLARLAVVGGADRQQIKSAVEAAMKERAELKLDPERDKLVEKVLAA